MNFPNLFREIDSFVINASHISDYVIINYSIPIIHMPPLLQTKISESQDEVVVRFCSNTKEYIITSAIAYLYHAVITCNIPTKYDLMETSRENLLRCNSL